MRASFVDQAIDLTDGGSKEALCLVLAAGEANRRRIITSICDELTAMGLPEWSVIRTRGLVMARCLLFVVCPPLVDRIRGLSPTLVVYAHGGYEPDADQFLRTRPAVRFY